MQALIDRKVKQKFILTGSSTRKLRRENVNLLGGRAWSLYLFPFTVNELGGDFDLNQVLSFGSLLPIFNEENDADRCETLRGYVDSYIEPEIKAEAVTRNL